MLKAATDLGEKVVIVSTSTQMLDAAARVCGGLGLPTGRIDGSTAAAVRQELVDQFNDTSAGTGGLVKVCSCHCFAVHSAALCVLLAGYLSALDATAIHDLLSQTVRH